MVYASLVNYKCHTIKLLILHHNTSQRPDTMAPSYNNHLKYCTQKENFFFLLVQYEQIHFLIQKEKKITLEKTSSRLSKSTILSPRQKRTQETERTLPIVLIQLQNEMLLVT